MMQPMSAPARYGCIISTPLGRTAHGLLTGGAGQALHSSVLQSLKLVSSLRAIGEPQFQIGKLASFVRRASVPDVAFLDPPPTRQIILPLRHRAQMREYLFRRQHIGVFGVHVTKVDGVTGLAAIKASVFDDGRAEV